ncbi:MAG: YceI family protein [Hyphomonadaceae bacterium]
MAVKPSISKLWGHAMKRPAKPNLRYALIALAAALPISAVIAPAGLAQEAPAGDYELDRTHASLTWKILHQGLTWYSARFTDMRAELTFDPDNVAKSKVSVTIAADSVETDYEKTRPAGNTTDFNKEIFEEERFFDGGAHPKITFVSTKVAKTGDNTGKLTGNLTFRGVTKPVTLDVTYIGHRNDPRRQKHKVGFSAVGSIKRSDFGMTFGQSFLSDEVKLEIYGEFVEK